ncbi:MAG: hypothetical protein U1F54_06930 [Burkholderiales bacterium]
MLDTISTLLNYVAVALDAVNSIGMVIAIALVAGILASIGGMIDTRMRLYGAIVGGMIMNIVVKAEGGGYTSALAAMLLVTALAYGLGSLTFLAQVLRRVGRKAP